MRSGGRVELTRDAVVAFGRRLHPDDEVVVEATGNTATIVRLSRPFVRRVVIANPLRVRAIAHAKVKTDKIDAGTLAKLHASGFLPEVRMPDATTEALRRLVAQRAQVVSQITRAKNRIHGVLHANLIPPYRGELFGAAGRLWLEAQPLAQDEKLAIRRHLADLDHRAADLAALDRALAGRTLEDDRVRRLITIAGVQVTVALGLLAAIGDIARFASPGKLVSYLGLNPSVRQSGNGPAFHGRISTTNHADGWYPRPGSGSRMVAAEGSWSEGIFRLRLTTTLAIVCLSASSPFRSLRRPKSSPDAPCPPQLPSRLLFTSLKRRLATFCSIWQASSLIIFLATSPACH